MAKFFERFGSLVPGHKKRNFLKVIDAYNSGLISYKVLFDNVENMPKGLENDKDIALKLLSTSGEFYGMFSKKVRNNPKVIMAAVSSYGDNLRNVPLKYRNNKDVVLAAMSNNVLAYEFASDEVKKDAAVRNYAKNHRREAIANMKTLRVEEDDKSNSNKGVSKVDRFDDVFVSDFSKTPVILDEMMVETDNFTLNSSDSSKSFKSR